MKGFILDSDTWIEFFRHRGGVDKHIAVTPAEQIFASEVSIAELTYGALHSNAVEKHLQEPKEIESTFTVLPLGDWMSDYAEIRQPSIMSFTSPCGILFDLLVTVYSLQNQPQMIFNDSFIVSNILHLNQSTLPVFMIANKKADGIISTQIALTV